jgi:hypothetical protein
MHSARSRSGPTDPFAWGGGTSYRPEGSLGHSRLPYESDERGPMIEVRLPKATPSAYLRWADWWTGVDRATADNQVLEAILNALVQGEVGAPPRSPSFGRRELCQRVLRQALVARREVREVLEPSISCHPNDLQRLGQWMEATSRFVDWWNGDPAASELIRLPRASWRTEHLHAGILQALRRRTELYAERTGSTSVIVDLVDAAAGGPRRQGQRAPEGGAR